MSEVTHEDSRILTTKNQDCINTLYTPALLNPSRTAIIKATFIDISQ